MTDTQTPGGWPDASRPGVPLNPERDGWHWLSHDSDKAPPRALLWLGAAWFPDANTQRSPLTVASWGYRYLGPVPHAAGGRRARRGGGAGRTHRTGRGADRDRGCAGGGRCGDARSAGGRAMSARDVISDVLTSSGINTEADADTVADAILAALAAAGKAVVDVDDLEHVRRVLVLRDMPQTAAQIAVMLAAAQEAADAR